MSHMITTSSTRDAFDRSMNDVSDDEVEAG